MKRRNVASWHKADMPTRSPPVRTDLFQLALLTLLHPRCEKWTLTSEPPRVSVHSLHASYTLTFEGCQFHGRSSSRRLAG
jgi:hypothetical protein